MILPSICRAAQDSSAANAEAAPTLAFATFGQGRSFNHPKPNSPRGPMVTRAVGDSCPARAFRARPATEVARPDLSH